MKNFTKKYGKWALITGGSSGIGLEFARQLATSGMNLILVARRSDVLAKQADELSRKYKVTVETIARDLTENGAVEALHEELSTKDIGLVVMSAGTEDTGHFTKVPLERHSQLSSINIDVPMRMSRIFGETMVKRRRGGLIFLSSLFGYQGVPMVANYAASKAYILTLGEALNVEMKPFNVDVLVLSPGLTNTKMPAQMPVNFNKVPMLTSSPAQVVRTALRALGKKATVVPGITNKIYAWENRFIPRSFPVKLFGFLLKNALHKNSRAELLHAK